MKNEFKNPSNLYRAKPFWSWNSELDELEIKRQVDIMEEMGFGGFFMHSRVGLVTEYLGDEWFDITNACADYAAQKGLESWLYDEDRWPSGSAGGMATINPEFRMKFIRAHVGTPKWDEHLIAAFSCRLDGLNIYDITPITEDNAITGDILWFDTAEFPCAPGFNGTSYLDTMKREATDEFIRLTHEKYREKCGTRLGSSIKGIFTDEPHRGEVMVDMQLSGQDISAWTPYTDSLFDDFQNQWGYDLRQKLPNLFYRENGEAVSQVKWHYCETIQELFLENFMKPVAEWCKTNHMLFTGHMLHENTLSAQAIMNGSMLRNYELMDVPGIDVLGLYATNYNIIKQLSSAAHQIGKKWLLSELYGCSGWQTSFADLKRSGDWHALYGINLRCPHLSWYSMSGQRKRDFPASISFHSAWYKEYKYVEDYFARLAVFMEQGTPLCNTLVIYPVESMWCQIHKGWAKWLETTSEKCLALEQQYKDMYNRLLSDNVEYDYGDEEMLSRLGSVENGTLHLGEATYTHVIVTGMVTIRSTTYAMLQEFERQGGKVTVLGDLPGYIDALPGKVSLGNADYADILQNRTVAAQNENIFSSVRADENGTYYVMLLNRNHEETIVTKLQAPCGQYTRYIPETGEKAIIPKPEELLLHPAEMILLEIDTTKDNAAATDAPVYPPITLGNDFAYVLDEPNVLVLDRVSCEYRGQKVTDEVLRVDSCLRDVCGIERRSGNMYQPWYQKKLGIQQYFDIKLTYEFQSEIETDAYLAAEQMERAQLCFNGEELQTDGSYWIDPCMKQYRIHIQKGTNYITADTYFADDTDIEAMYILGDFGVFDGVIRQRPHKITYGDIVPQGFPHYGGKIKYIFQQAISEPSLLRLSGLHGAAAIKVNDKLVAWAPYEAVIDPCDEITVELLLTRRNTFGPLHHYPIVETANPRIFVSEGKHWRDEMMLIPNGLNDLNHIN